MSGESMNGYTLSGVVLPEEVLILLMSFVDHHTLLSCRLVCHMWRELVDAHVWRCKLRREKHRYHSGRAIDVSQDLPWIVYYSIFNKDPYGRNLIKNPCGEDGLKHWNILQDGGERFIVEEIPLGCDEVPEGVGNSSCFVTSYGECSKEQWINLAEEGIPPRVMDEVQPAIHVCDWYANRFDCGAVYELRVSLCDGNRERLMTHTALKKMVDGENMSWSEKSHIFWRYPAGIRYIVFYHRGKDNKFWAGHYGAKMTGSSVKLTFIKDNTDSAAETSDEDTTSYESFSDDHLYSEEDSSA